MCPAAREDDVVAAITAEGGRAVAVQATVAEAQDVKRLFEEAVSAFGQIDILVNNAAVYGPTPLEDIAIEQYRRHFGTNVLRVIPTMAARCGIDFGRMQVLRASFGKWLVSVTWPNAVAIGSKAQGCRVSWLRRLPTSGRGSSATQ